MAIEIRATGRAIPSLRLSNDDLAKTLDTNDEWIRSHTGIRARHIADESTACSDLALEAARQALAMAITKEGKEIQEETLAEAALTLDMIILGTATPDYHGCPSVSCIVQDKLGARNAFAMDITAGCTGFIYGLETAAALLTHAPSRKRALVIGSEILSRFLDWNDRKSCVLFGDGAGAVLLEKTREDPKKRGLLGTILEADGSGAEHIIIRQGGSRHAFKTGDSIKAPPIIEMNGRAVYNFAVKSITETIEKLLAETNLTIDEVHWIIPHQANRRILAAAGKRMGIPEERFFLNLEEYANTSAASIPIALDELNRGGKLQKGDIIMTIGFGAGLTSGGNVIVW
ncbi:MAG: ketoacyl-ACP synthase III [Treponema sp.]|jgi:3-oxoacyl-[acyl-carrier-protein] synthase-3|nr:ketoacyl-ACP synthase III [Treponema sp.]